MLRDGVHGTGASPAGRRLSIPATKARRSSSFKARGVVARCAAKVSMRSRRDCVPRGAIVSFRAGSPAVLPNWLSSVLKIVEQGEIHVHAQGGHVFPGLILDADGCALRLAGHRGKRLG